MPKMKTHSGAKKRYKISGKGKILREQQMKAHLLEHKSSRRKRRLAGEVEVASADASRIKRLLGRA